MDLTTLGLKKPLITESYDLKIVNDNADKVNELITADREQINSFATKIINESGSNANGSYVKFEDGTMICTYATTFLNLGITTPNGVAFYTSTNQIWTYPATFVDNPKIAFSSTYFTIDFVWINNAATVNTTYRPGAYSSKTAEARISMIAIGRWKA